MSPALRAAAAPPRRWGPAVPVPGGFPVRRPPAADAGRPPPRRPRTPPEREALVLRHEPGPLAIDADEGAELPGGAPLGAGRLPPGAPADIEARQGLCA